MQDNPGLDRDQLLDLYRMMLRIRKFEDCVRHYHVGGKAPGLVHLCTGQEAVSTGFIAALNRDDYITIYHRGHGHCIAKGSPMDKVLGELLHKREGLCGGRTGEPHLCDADVNNIGSTGIVAGNIPQAVGAALAAKIRGTTQVAASFFGDGSLNQGVLFEVMNMASIWSLPIVFVCEDNKYGEFTEGASVTAGDSYADRGAMLGIPSEFVDGMDVLAVREAAERTVERARRGGGPSFLVCETYRFTGHHVSDKQEYKQSDEMEAWLKRDPIPNFAAWLKENGHVDDASLAAIDAALDDEIAAAAASADAMTDPTFEDLGTHVYAG